MYLSILAPFAFACSSKKFPQYEAMCFENIPFFLLARANNNLRKRYKASPSMLPVLMQLLPSVVKNK